MRTANVGLCSSQENLKPSSFSSTNVQVLPVMFRTEESLKERREKMALNFAKKSLRLDKFSELFPFNNAKHLMKKRNHEKYAVTNANTERYRKSAVPFLQRLLNDDYARQKKDLKCLLQVNNDIT